MRDEEKAIERLKESACKECKHQIFCDDCVINQAAGALEFQKKNRWIPVGERLPEEHDSIFAKLKGTDKWNNAMYEKTSDNVLVTVEYNERRFTMPMRTIDGKWELAKGTVIAWKPLPEPYKESDSI